MNEVKTLRAYLDTRWVDDGTPDGKDDQPCLSTYGCDCCSSKKDPTLENLNAARAYHVAQAKRITDAIAELFPVPAVTRARRGKGRASGAGAK